MADEQDKWLDRETAELLLRGEPLEGVDPAARERAGRLVVALGALSAVPARTSEELPGEAAALAVFRKARAESADVSASAALAHGTAPRPSDAGLVRIGPRGDTVRRPRWNRPLRLGLAAALTVGMVGGVAVAAGTGVLPTPFHSTEPEPAATVSAAASPDRPLVSPSPLDGAQGESEPDGTTPDASGGGTTRDRGKAGDRDADDRDTGGSDGRRSHLAASCRKVRSGKELDGAHKRALKEAAGGSSRVGKYCGDLLEEKDSATRDRTGSRDGREHGDSGDAAREGELRKATGDGGGKGDEGSKGNKGDKNGKGDGDGKGGKKGDDGDDGKGGKDDRGDKGDKGDKDDDDDSHIAPPDRNPHVPHAPHGPRTPSSYELLSRQGPVYAPHPSSAASVDAT
ncbi:hypothetical protein [Streptomyces sp. AC512_CC834]|uniref:hypothetical protein n=1 Tax=Streptomyces sp. AC512_CC834 TaxID=2823691 RepID=UPI001C263996|nr:hypothetical protein [Streptomyces sp. AC512_CC834]